jgi:hypothetical protein
MGGAARATEDDVCIYKKLAAAALTLMVGRLREQLLGAER